MAEKKKKFLLFNTQREGKGVEKADANLPPNLKRFWILWRENFTNRLLTLNIMMILGNFPAIFIVMALLGVGSADYTMPVGNLFGVMNGVNALSGGFTPSSLAMMGVAGMQIVKQASTAWTYVFYGLGALTIFTWGAVSVGSTYILRNLVMGRPIFLWSDFVDAIRTNWKQALPFGIIDLGIMGILCFNIFQMVQGGTYLASFFFWVNVVLFILYFIMRQYVYLQIVSFDMKLFKMVKNAAYFVLLGFKRNMLALLGVILLSALGLLFFSAFGGRLVIVSLVLFACLFFSNVSLMLVYAGWFKIDEIMVIHDADKKDDADQTSDVVTEESPE